MKVTKAEFIISAASQKQYPNEPIPEIALAGRSNVGKSSFINRMISRKNLARTSQKPGKTQTLNFYKLNDHLHFVDVPGYGYAKVSKKERDRWGHMMEEYFSERENLQAVVLITDIRHKPTKDDQMMYDFLKHFELPVIVIATKADKVSRGKHEQYLKRTRETLQMEKEDPLILFSAETGLGRDQAWKAIQSFI